MVGAGALDEAGALAPDGAPLVRLRLPAALKAPLVVPFAVATEPLTEPLAVALAGADAVLGLVEGAVAGAGVTAGVDGGDWDVGAGGGAGVAGVPKPGLEQAHATLAAAKPTAATTITENQRLRAGRLISTLSPPADVRAV